MKLRHLFYLGALVLVALGCGGGGGGSSTADAGALFMTDSLDSHDHVWVTVQKVVLTTQGGAKVTVFNDASGKTIDLKTLRDPAGERYSFVGMVKSGTYTSATFTLDKDLVLFASGSSTGELREFSGNNGATVDMELVFGAPQTFNATNHFAVDFDLTNWTDTGTVVTGAPFLAAGTGVGLSNTTRHEEENLHGTVHALAGTFPDQTFRLDLESGGSVRVMTNSDTVFSEFATLSDGMQVKVRGVYSVNDQMFLAASIRAESDDGDDPEVEGTVSNIVVIGGTFDLEVDEVENFFPMVDVIHVETSPLTVFTDVHGDVVLAAAFFAALVNGDELEVKGSYDAVTHVLTATSVEFEDEEN